MNRLQRMLIACSGAAEDVLERDECIADAKKYAMIGTFVLLTAIFAFFSSTFALYTGMGSLPLAVALGVAWALMIFTLDRFIVSGVRKSDVEGLAPRQQHVRRLVEVLVTLPRILLAALISVVVATPLELRFFQREIDAQLEKNQTLARQTVGDDLNREFDELGPLRSKNDELQKTIDEAWKNHAAADMLAVQESVGTGLTTLTGKGPVYEQLKARADHLARLAAQTDKTNTAAIARSDAQIARLEKEREGRLTQAETAIDKSGGFLARYGALGELGRANSDIAAARVFFTLLFLAIELTPVLMKLLLRRGPYDEFMDTLEHTVHVKELTVRSHMNDDAHTEVELHSQQNAKRVAVEKDLTDNTFTVDTFNKVAASELEEAQRKLARISIQKWLHAHLAMFGSLKASRIPVRKPEKGNDHGQWTPPPAEAPKNDAGASV